MIGFRKKEKQAEPIVEGIDHDELTQSIPAEALAWMESVGIQEIGKPLEYHSLHSDMLYSRDYLANTPLEELIEKEAKNRDLMKDGKLYELSKRHYRLS